MTQGGALMKRPRILVIENDEAVAGRVVSFLGEAGYDVVRAADAAVGLAMIYETHPDLVIMAGSLPVINGEDPCLRIRQASYLPIIVLGGIYDAIEALELGADAYMNKPPGREELVARVNALLRRRTADSGLPMPGSDYDFFGGHFS
jgi:DNA-binding response OmpR family regulator